MHSEDSEQTGWAPGLVWVFAGLMLVVLVSPGGRSLKEMKLPVFQAHIFMYILSVSKFLQLKSVFILIDVLRINKRHTYSIETIYNNTLDSSQWNTTRY